MSRILPITLAFVCTALFVACGSGPKDPPTASLPAKKTWTREEFRNLVMGKTPDEVLKAVGKPETTQESGSDTNWYYERVTIDPLTGKTDLSVQVCFKKGVVAVVNY